MSVPTITLTGAAVTGIAPHLAGHARVAALPTTVRLGRVKSPTRPTLAPRFGTYFDAGHVKAALPSGTNYRAKAAAVLAEMYLNNELGCCVISGLLHAIGVWAVNDGGGTVRATADEVRQQYRSICGHLGDDAGCIITEALDAAAGRGLRLGGVVHKIDGYVAGDWTNKLQVQTATYALGPSVIGMDLPGEWTSAAVWDVTGSAIVGGHLVTVLDYGPEGVYVSSWGRIFLMTWAAFLSRRWVDEWDVPLSPDWYGSDHLAPSGIDAATLRKDLALIGQGKVPGVDPPPVPPTPTPPPPGPAPDPSLPARVVSGGWRGEDVQVGFVVGFPAGSKAGVLSGLVTTRTK